MVLRLWSLSASLMTITLRSRAMASKILRRFSALERASWGRFLVVPVTRLLEESLSFSFAAAAKSGAKRSKSANFSLETPSTSVAISALNASVRSALVISQSSITSWRNPAAMVAVSTSSCIRIPTTSMGWVIYSSPDFLRWAECFSKA